MSLDKIRAVINTEEMVSDFNEAYDIEIVIIRKSDGFGTKLSIGGLHEVFQLDFLSQFITSIRNHEAIDKQIELNEYMKKLNKQKKKRGKKK